MAHVRLIATLVGVLSMCAGFILPAPAAAAERYPVWWTPEIGNESLNEIDALLAEPFPPEFRHRLYKYRLETREKTGLRNYLVGEKLVDDCVSLFELTSDGYEPGLPFDNFWRYRRAFPGRYALRALARATPAGMSYVRDFVMDVNTLDYMPALLGYWTCRERIDHLRANREGVSWNRFDFGGDSGWGFRVAVVEGRNRFVLRARSEDRGGGHDEVFEIIGRGDFNNDSLDDILLRMTFVDYPPDEYNTSELFFLSRHRPDDVLRVAEVLSPMHAERNRCIPRVDDLWQRP